MGFILTCMIIGAFLGVALAFVFAAKSSEERAAASKPERLDAVFDGGPQVVYEHDITKPSVAALTEAAHRNGYRLAQHVATDKSAWKRATLVFERA